ncbi:hypothetical protein HOO68_05230, partial [Candidatus Gracilibacteria bacterium]|nr:hypothetical protein [Candidatus Gracilibacteria bacterium]
ATGNIATLTTNLATTNSNVSTLSGNLATTNSNLATTNSNVTSLSGSLATLSSTVATKIGLTALSAVGPLTYNNLTGVFGILTANSTTTGALSSTDWNTFNNKIGLTALSATGGFLTYNNLTGVFGWTGTTTNLTEGTNLYFTNTRAQNALSGTIAAITGSIATTNSNVTSLSGSLGTTNSNLATTNSNLATATGNIATLTTNLATTNTNVSTLSGNLATTNSNLATTNSNVTSLSGSLATLNTTVSTLSGSTVGLTASLNSLSGTVAGHTTSISTLTTGLATTNTNLATATGNIATLTTNLATTNSNVSTLSGNLATTNSNLATTNSNVTSLSGSLATLSSTVATKIGLTALSAVGPLTYNNLTGVFGILTANSTTTGALSSTDWNTFNNKIGLTALSASGGISYNNLTGIFSDLFTFNNGLSRVGNTIGLTLGTNGTVLTMSGGVPTWITPSSASSFNLNGLTGATQNFVIGTSGTTFNVSSIGSTHTFNIPDASGVARGFVSTGSQAFVGTKTFISAPVISFTTPGSILFAGSGGIISQDNNALYWDNNNKRLGIGTNNPVATFHNSGSTVFGTKTISNLPTGGSIGIATDTVDIYTIFNVNQTNSGQTITLPNPTDSTAGRMVYVTNNGTTPFTIMSTQLSPNSARSMIWNGTVWVLAGNADDKTVGLARKILDQTGAQNIPKADPDLKFAVKAGETWMFQITGITRTTNSFKVQMLVPAGTTGCSNTVSTNYTGNWYANALCNTDITMGVSTTGAGGADSFIYAGVFKAGADGTAQLQWTNASATTATLTKDSTINYTRLSGADVAEVYYTNDQDTTEGNIVSLNGEGVSQVSKSTIPYDSHALGIISTKPGLTLGEADGTGKPVIVGLSGRVPVKVSTKNGDIKPGDYITTSDIPGVGMKATEAGRVIGKALTSLTGVDEGLVAVFIQNTYFDGVDEVEYNSFLSNTQSGNILSGLTSPLDRFSFMVNKSLTKIDPSFGSGGTTSFSAVFTSLSKNLESLSGSVNSIFEQFTSLSGTVNTLQSRIDAMSGTTQIIQNTNSPVSTEDQSLLDAIIGAIDSLIVQVKTTFNEIVIFVKSVTFQSTVTFEDRVTFQDKDMAGTAVLQSGQKSVRVTFAQAYSETPKITISADTFAKYRVTNKSITGFTIETQEAVTEETSFDWIAIMVVGSSTSHTSTVTTPESNSGTTTPATSNSGSENTNTESGTVTPVIPPTETVVTPVVENPTPELVPEAITPESNSGTTTPATSNSGSENTNTESGTVTPVIPPTETVVTPVVENPTPELVPEAITPTEPVVENIVPSITPTEAPVLTGSGS